MSTLESNLNNGTTTSDNGTAKGYSIPGETAFSIMFVSVGMSCFMWQSITAGWMFYKARKPIIGIVFAQATLGTVVTFVTLLTSLIEVDCTFRLLFSVVGVNIGDMSLQFVLLWKAYLGNNRSKIILVLGTLPIISIAAFIIVNMTFGKSKTFEGIGICTTEYPLYIVIAKAAIDCSSNTFLSGCFILVIYRHYRILGSSIQKTLITEGLIYCFGVCFSNILTGILLTKNVIGGSTPILYTIDWYLASYLIIMQLRQRNPSNERDALDNQNNDDTSTIESFGGKKDEEDDDEPSGRRYNRDTFYSSIDGTLVLQSPEFNDDEKYLVTSLPNLEHKIFVASSVENNTKTQQHTNTSNCITFSDIMETKDSSGEITSLNRSHSITREESSKYLSKKSIDQSTIVA